MNTERIFEFCDKLFELQREYGLYMDSAQFSNFDNSPVFFVWYDDFDYGDNGFYTIGYMDMNKNEICHREYKK